MKRSQRKPAKLYRQGGILSKSTSRLLTGAGLVGMAMTLSSCGDSSVTTLTEEDLRMVRVQDEVERVDQGTAQLSTGEVANNFFIEGLGYYHARAHQFFELPYQHKGSDGRYFVDGEWSDVPGPVYVSPSRPSPEALEKTQQALAAVQEKQSAPAEIHHHHGGFGMGNALLMYMLLSGNRGFFTPNAAYHKAAQQAPQWQQNVNQSRQRVQTHAAANPQFRKMVSSRATAGQTVSPGGSVRGGIGSTGKSSSGGIFSGS